MTMKWERMTTAHCAVWAFQSAVLTISVLNLNKSNVMQRKSKLTGHTQPENKWKNDTRKVTTKNKLL